MLYLAGRTNLSDLGHQTDVRCVMNVGNHFKVVISVDTANITHCEQKMCLWSHHLEVIFIHILFNPNTQLNFAVTGGHLLSIVF